MTKPIKTLDVKPQIPDALSPLKDLAENLWFVWHYDGDDLFRRMNPDLWIKTNRNPVELMCRLSQRELADLGEDEGFLAHMERVRQEFDRYVSERPDPNIFGEQNEPFLVAYFTAECGIADCLPIYSGGLGILSGDHLKSASDLNFPIIGVSLAYQRGYFKQYLSQDGWQMETYPINEFSMMPMTLIRNQENRPITIQVDLKGTAVMVQAWQVRIGRASLYLLDTNLKQNPAWARAITAELYGGDREMRIQQEIVLGIGGVRMLHALGLEPKVYHMNEGHSAFASFERIRQLREEKGLSFNESIELVRITNVFTTHTPVPAGIDRFSTEQMYAYFESFARAMGISMDVLLGFGKEEPRERSEEFSMAVLALRLSTWNNGVSRLHGRVSRRMWQRIWPKTPEIDLPIKHVTNGVHIPTWISKGMAENYDRYLGPRWIEDPDNKKVWERVDQIPDTELWRTHERGRERLVAFTRERLRQQLVKRGVPNRDLAIADEVLDSDVLTIGFARRFAPYKRASLILKDMVRLEKILLHEDHPVQMVFAGKAHPQDNRGKELIKHLFQIANQEHLRRNIVFLEDYDMETARYMVQGVDVWLNTPRRPLEACGTSGMKASANGALQLSVLDGWWDEGFDREVGWAIGGGEEYEDTLFQDELESRALYDILEKDVVPSFYERGRDGIPRKWLVMMKASLHKLCPVFNTHRMVEDYWDHFYMRAARGGNQYSADGYDNLKRLAKWRETIMYNWSKVEIKEIRMDDAVELQVGTFFRVEADISIGELHQDDILVEAYCGRLDHADQFVDRFIRVMKPIEAAGDGIYRYQGEIRFQETGRFGLNIRITPNHPNFESRHAMGLVIWGQ